MILIILQTYKVLLLSEAPVEQVFSRLKLIVQKQRVRLTQASLDMLLYIGINGPNGTAGKLVPSITMERTVDLAYRIWRAGKLRRIDAKCVEAKFPDGYDGECGWGSGFEGKEEYAPLDRESAGPRVGGTGKGAKRETGGRPGNGDDR